MTDKTFTIIEEDKEPTPHDMLKKHLAALPQDQSTADLIGEFFDRCMTRNGGRDFYLRPFDARLDPHGLLAGFNEAIAVFWRPSIGYFWFNRTAITFQHEAAFLPNSTAPIVDVPRVLTSYRFQRGEIKTIAIPASSFLLANDHRRMMEEIRIKRLLAGKGKFGDDDGPAFRPTDGYTLLGGDKL